MANGLASLVNLILSEPCTHRPHKRASVWPNFGKVAAPNQAFLPSSVISKSSADLTMDSGAIANSADFLVIMFLVCDNPSRLAGAEGKNCSRVSKPQALEGLCARPKGL